MERELRLECPVALQQRRGLGVAHANGNQVRGSFAASGCGIEGAFRGTVAGNMLTGTVDMLGCTGGAVTGRLEAGALTFTVGDFRKDLISGDAEVLPGGQARLQR